MAMDFNGKSIDKNSPIPLYYQLKKLLIEKIKNDELQPGDALPTEADLEAAYGVSRTTIRQAVNELAMEGHLYKIKNKGTFVAQQKIVQRFMQGILSYDYEMEFQGMTPKTELLSFSLIPPSKQVMEGLNLTNSRQVIRLYRRRFANNEPILIVENHVSFTDQDIFNQDFESNSLYEYLSRNSETAVIKLTRCIEATIAGSEESMLLNIPMGYPIQMATSIGYNKAGKPIEYSIVKYRGDKNKFIVDCYVAPK